MKASGWHGAFSTRSLGVLGKTIPLAFLIAVAGCSDDSSTGTSGSGGTGATGGGTGGEPATGGTAGSGGATTGGTGGTGATGGGTGATGGEPVTGGAAGTGATGGEPATGGAAGTGATGGEPATGGAAGTGATGPGDYTVPVVDWPSTECVTQAEQILGQMTVEQKAAQMVMGLNGDLTGSLSAGTLGNAFSGGSFNPGGTAPANWATFLDGLIAAAASSPLGVPLLYGLDAVHGDFPAQRRTRLDAQSIPGGGGHPHHSARGGSHRCELDLRAHAQRGAR
jgi:hypothetical protein